MQRWLFLLAVMAIAVVNVGCGAKSDGPGAADAQAADAKASAGQAAVDVPPPDVAVMEFLNAVKRGDDERSAQMLTPLARQKTAELDMVVAPPGSDTATFKVGQVELVADGEVAHVESTWTDLGDDGKPRDESIIWMLRREPEGWRIAGMATELFEGELPLLLNFEDPQDMLEKERLAQEEILRRQQAPSGEAAATMQQPGASEAATQPGPALPIRQ